eukprot:329133-Chlamydomonas_euryale.AAC.1
MEREGRGAEKGRNRVGGAGWGGRGVCVGGGDERQRQGRMAHGRFHTADTSAPQASVRCLRSALPCGRPARRTAACMTCSMSHAAPHHAPRRMRHAPRPKRHS